MELDITNLVKNPINLDLPDRETLDQYLDEVVPKVKPWGEDLREHENYMDTRWLEINDRDDFHESVLHIFRAENEYLISIDGNIHKGVWNFLKNSNTLILEKQIGGAVVTSELFDVAFMNKDFFVLRKHGDQIRKGFPKYLLLGRENLVRGLEWREVIELIYSKYRSNTQLIVVMVFAAIVLAVVLIFTFF